MEPTNAELMTKLTEVLAEVTKLKKKVKSLEEQLNEVVRITSNTEAAMINLSTPGV